jgi:hypothetical protein
LGTVLLLYGLSEAMRSSLSRPSGAALALGFAVFLCAAFAARGSGVGQLILLGLSLAVLAWQLPIYFSTYRPWPGLVFVALASGTFGIGLLGYLLDRHPGSGGAGTPL